MCRSLRKTVYDSRSSAALHSVWPANLDKAIASAIFSLSNCSLLTADIVIRK